MFVKSLVEFLYINDSIAVTFDGQITPRTVTYHHTNRPINPSAFASMSKETVMLVDNKEYPVYYINFHDTTDAVIIWWAYENEKERDIDFNNLCKVRV